MTAYGDISPRTAAYASRELLKRGIPYLVLEKFGQAKPIPMRSSKAITFRRYEALDPTPAALTEGVTPDASSLTNTDVTATLVQYGDRIQLTDVIQDTHEDPVFMESQDILGEQAAQMIETVRFNVLKAGTNVFYANGTARDELDTAPTRTMQRRVTRALKRQNARKVSRVVRSTASFNTENVAPSFIGLCHPDLEGDIRNMEGFVPVENYGQLSPYESELGKVEDVRYITSTIFEPWADAGAATSTMISTTGTNADVYPILYIARDAYGIVPLKGKQAITPMVVNPKPSDSDPLGQRGHVAWKSMQTAVILNDLWMARAEVAATE
ncbi:MAG: N4-gp56 family major capsid protein [Candidatus Thiodiazotropha sp.]|jgi:N4-gp56 family major capsid protein